MRRHLDYDDGVRVVGEAIAQAVNGKGRIALFGGIGYPAVFIASVPISRSTVAGPLDCVSENLARDFVHIV